MSNDKAGEARQGLFDSVAGKAKEVAGAVTDRDDLVEEGRLQQADAQNRKDAVAEEAVAGAKAHEATEELRETHEDVAGQQRDAHEQAVREEAAVDRRREADHATAERQAAQQEVAGVEAAEEDADRLAEARLREAEDLEADADTTEQQAAAEQARLEREAAAADLEAAQLRAQTEK